jgi:muconolactone delta-isomerase
MPSYLVETFLAREATAECAAREWRARSTAGELRRQGVMVRFDRMIRRPQEDACLFVFDAASAREAALVAELAELGPFRVVEDARSAAG